MMRGASADAYAATRGVLDGAGLDPARTGSDLFGVAQLLREEPALRRVATDVSVSAEARSDLIGDVLGGKVGDDALSVVRKAVAQRWTRARDLADTLEELGVASVVRAAGDDSARLADELFAVDRTIRDNHELRDALSDPARSVSDKRDLVRSLLEGKTLPGTVTLVEQSLSGSYRTVGVALEAYQKIAADVAGERVATVRVAQPLSEEESRRLADVLARQYDRPVHLNTVVDPAVIGGVRVEIGDDVIDGTVASRLQAARRQLAG